MKNNTYLSPDSEKVIYKQNGFWYVLLKVLERAPKNDPTLLISVFEDNYTRLQPTLQFLKQLNRVAKKMRRGSLEFNMKIWVRRRQAYLAT